MKSKKGTGAGDLQGLALAIILVIVMIASGALIFANMERTFTYQQSATAAQNITMSEVPVTLAQNDLVSLAAYNWSGTATTLTTGNYTINLPTGVFTGVSASEYNGTLVQVRYSYYYEDYASNATLKGLTSMSDLAGWMPLIVVCVVAAIIIALLALGGAFRIGKR